MLVYSAALVLNLCLEVVDHCGERSGGTEFLCLVCDHVIEFDRVYSSSGGPVENAQICHLKPAKYAPITQLLCVFDWGRSLLSHCS